MPRVEVVKPKRPAGFKVLDSCEDPRVRRWLAALLGVKLPERQQRPRKPGRGK
jgi:hypothetical protein